jgi:hypothetical protein
MFIKKYVRVLEIYQVFNRKPAVNFQAGKEQEKVEILPIQEIIGIIFGSIKMNYTE